MKLLYTRPLRVYVILGFLALWGIYSAFQLPISLFPNSNQSIIGVSVPVGSLSSQQFFDVYGRDLESSLQGLKVNNISVKELEANYYNHSNDYEIKFDWGVDPAEALREVKTLVNTKLANASEEIRRGISVNTWGGNKGFFAVSFYSPMRSLDELYKILEPFITPIRSQIEDSDNLGLWNPNSKEITISLFPEKLAQYELSTLQVQRSIQSSVISLIGGTVKIGEKDLILSLPKNVSSIEEISQIRVSPKGRPSIFVKDIAKIKIGISKDSRRKFKTSGVDSLILFASPKDGGNIKRMSDQILFFLKNLEKQWPADVKYKVLVNPSEFINNSIFSVIKEVFLAAFLAVVVLFLFIGNFRNVITAAIEIPLSLLMAFIMMKIFGMNLNLVSLGGLALSAGMNVDASVVVLENIIRHFENAKGKLNYQQQLQIVVNAVNEVRLPIIASTIASLVVFLPLIFTEGLTQSLLGDLAKAVIFSHGLSAIVALVLVPTIRLQLLSFGFHLESKSPIESKIVALEKFYKRTLLFLMQSRGAKILVFSSIALLLPLLFALVLPRLEKEVIGKPDSDWLIVGMNSPLFTSIKQMESELDSMETVLKEKYPDEILYTFTQINGYQNGNVMFRIKNKKKILSLLEDAENSFKNTATKFYWHNYWNPSELNIPDPPQYRLEITGGTAQSRLQAAQDIQGKLLEKNVFDKLSINPTARMEKEIRVKPYLSSGSESEVISKEELSHLLRVATDGIYTEHIVQNESDLPIYLRMNSPDLKSIEEIKSFPIGFEGRLIPLGALAQISIEDREPRLYRENQKSMIVLTVKLTKSEKPKLLEKKLLANNLVQEYKNKSQNNESKLPNIVEVQADKELTQALDQLTLAVIISIILIFITMVIQLGDIVNSLLVLVSIPLGLIGVLSSLYIFNSTLSLNSGLGTILLNGIAVANSIILVDFIRELHSRGKSALEATLEASVSRLRPILMTSLTTVLGMLPIAFGAGEGGKILQPLGIAVCGGLWVSMLLTLYIVPTLQCMYLSRKEK